MKNIKLLPKALMCVFMLGLLCSCSTGGSSSGNQTYLNSTIVPNSTVKTDPTPVTNGAKITYDLTTGVPDPQGPMYASSFTNMGSTIGPVMFAGVSITGADGVSGVHIGQPSDDVLAAWNSGWTGRGVNVLLFDQFGPAGTICTNNNYGICHAAINSFIVNSIAPGASLYGATNYVNLNQASGLNAVTGNALQTPVNIQVVNMSVDASSWGDRGNAFTPNSAQWAADISQHAAGNATWVSVLNGTSSISNINNLSNALLVKSAGNDAIDAKYESTTYTLAHDVSTANRLLIVGAVIGNGSVFNPTSLLSYSNVAGTDPAISSRFVLANGVSPWSAAQINGWSDPGNIGTSLAAPVVAGYAAIVMQKFPNLDAVKTSNIILDTARYDTLTCYPNCPVAVYGQGEASLSRALAPVGYLR